MKRIAGGTILSILAVLVGAAFATSLPALSGERIQGRLLLLHMVAGSGLVFTLPIFAVTWLLRCIDVQRSRWLECFGYLIVILGGLVSIITVFICMLPIPSTSQMHELMTLHKYAGWLTVPAVLALLIGVWHSHRKTSQHPTPTT